LYFVQYSKSNLNTRCVIVIDDHEASPSSSDCMT